MRRKIKGSTMTKRERAKVDYLTGERREIEIIPITDFHTKGNPLDAELIINMNGYLVSRDTNLINILEGMLGFLGILLEGKRIRRKEKEVVVEDCWEYGHGEDYIYDLAKDVDVHDYTKYLMREISTSSIKSPKIARVKYISELESYEKSRKDFLSRKKVNVEQHVVKYSCEEGCCYDEFSYIEINGFIVTATANYEFALMDFMVFAELLPLVSKEDCSCCGGE